MGYVRSLDGVRALAIILVMSFHANLNHFGWMGVQLFFVLSGYLITGILWKEKEQPGSIGFKLKKFWVRRSLRIFPLYFGFLLFISLVYLLLQFPVYYPTYIPYLATYTFNYTRTFEGWEGNPLFTHFWSLSIEEQFYLFFPLLIFFSTKKISRILMTALILISPFIRFLLFRFFSHHGNDTAADTVYWHTLSHLDAFFIGGAIPVFGLDKKIKRPQIILVVSLLVVLVTGVINFLTYGGDVYTWTMGYGHGETLHYEYVWHYTLLDILFGSLILSLVSMNAKQNPVRKWLESDWLVRIGKVSYGMYIFHWAVLVYLFNRVIPTQNLAYKLFLFLPYVFVVYLLAELSYRLYESRFIVLKDKLFPDKRGKKAIADDNKVEANLNP
jgi:peptidoglycan/LPS O-acetylase OafA/YrhL